MRRRRRAYVVDGAPCDEASIASARARGGTSSDGGFEVEFGDETSSGGAWGASSIGGACEATTRIDSAIAGTEDVDGALALRYTIDANFSAAIEARVVREEGGAYAREVHLGSLRANANANADAVGWIRGLIVAPKRAMSAAFDQAMGVQSRTGNFTESLILMVDASPSIGGERARGTIWSATIESIEDGDDPLETEDSTSENNLTNSSDGADAYARALESMAEAVRAANERAPTPISPADRSAFIILWSLLGSLGAICVLLVAFTVVRRRGRQSDSKKGGDGGVKTPDKANHQSSATRNKARAIRESVEITSSAHVTRHRSTNAPIFAHTTALSRRAVRRNDSLGALNYESSFEEDDHVALDVNRTQDSEEFHQHALDIDRTREEEVDDACARTSDDSDRSNAYRSALEDDKDESAGTMEMTAADLVKEVTDLVKEEKIGQADKFTYISSDDFEKYVYIFEKLGSGGHSTVYSAKWRDRHVAVKIMHDLEDRATLQSEIEIMRSIDHPSIVKIYGACLSQNCLLMQIVHGGSLHELLHCSGSAPAPLAKNKALRIARDIASAMTYLHGLEPKIIHRDLKPQNVLIEQDTERPYLADFGVSRAVQTSLSLASLGAGTANYMAPELFGDERADEKVDVYSFAMILYEMMTGMQPWKGIHPVKIAATVLTGPRPDLPETISPDVAALVRECWRFQAKKRPTFLEILSTLEELKK